MADPRRIAVLGAGLAVVVLHKGRGIGGRRATRRVEERSLSFDHGAQFLHARGQDCLYDRALKWCLGPRLEAAFDSGAAVADRVVADLGEPG